MLRVRTDACSEQGGLLLFDDQALSGIGAEVTKESTAGGAPAGSVTLWSFHEGKRIGPWVEPDFRGDQALIVDEEAIAEDPDGYEVVLIEVQFQERRVTLFEPEPKV